MGCTDTCFAPAETADAGTLAQQSGEIGANAMFRNVVTDMPEMIMMLNRNRQIIYANRSLCGFAGVPSDRDAIGKRPGELFRCIHAGECNGCGTTEFCRYCGAAQAIVSIQSEPARAEVKLMDCSITTVELDSLELQVCTLAWPENREYILMTVRDIADTKWRRGIEKLFFCDVLNMLNAMRSTIAMEAVNSDLSRDEIIDLAVRSSTELIEEISCQRDLLAACENSLSPRWITVETSSLLQSTQLPFIRIFAGQGKTLTVEEPDGNFSFITDPGLLKRILSNMLKNALEASTPGDEIILASRLRHDGCMFSVSNPGDMPEQVRMQIFKRSFSTKGRNRGQGTYSMRLLTEKYLKGRISFSSDREHGTVFTVMLPSRPPLKTGV